MSEPTPSAYKHIARAHTRAVYRTVIRLLIEGKLTQRQIAKRFRLTESFVSKLKYGERGREYTADIRPNWTPPELLSREDIRAIYRAAWAGVPQAEIKARYRVSVALISGIKRYKRHTAYTADLERARREAMEGGAP